MACHSRVVSFGMPAPSMLTISLPSIASTTRFSKCATRSAATSAMRFGHPPAPPARPNSRHPSCGKTRPAGSRVDPRMPDRTEHCLSW